MVIDTFLQKHLFKEFTPPLFILEDGGICLEAHGNSIIEPLIHSSFVHAYKPCWCIEVNSPGGGTWLEFCAHDNKVFVTVTEAPNPIDWVRTDNFSSWQEFEQVHKPIWSSHEFHITQVFNSAILALFLIVLVLVLTSILFPYF